MAQSYRKYYPVAGKQSPYVILDPDMDEEYIKYDADFTKFKSFSRMAKYIIVIWLVLATFVIIHQAFYKETVILEDRSFFHSVSFVFASDDEEPKIEFRKETNDQIFQGLEKCTQGVTYMLDKCNSCSCNDGRLACTKMFCPDANEESPFVLF